MVSFTIFKFSLLAVSYQLSVIIYVPIKTGTRERTHKNKMLPNNLSDFTKLEEVFSTEKKDLSLISHYGKFYHNLESSAKCPRCENLGELIESGSIRSLYRCEKCGIFAKLTKRQGLAGDPIKCRLKSPCQGCGENHGIITPVDRTTGNPHSYRLDCRDCGRFQRWVSQNEFDRKIGKQGGHGNA